MTLDEIVKRYALWVEWLQKDDFRDWRDVSLHVKAGDLSAILDKIEQLSAHKECDNEDKSPKGGPGIRYDAEWHETRTW